VGTSYVAISPVVVHHLRCALDEALGPGRGKSVIQTGCGQEYRYALAPDELAAHVKVMPGFVAMAEMKVISSQEANVLLDALRVDSPPRPKSKRNPQPSGKKSGIN
jgi:hypothetical protein